MPMSMVAPTAGLLGVGLVLALLAGPMFSVTDRAAEQLIGRADYIEAVLGPEALAKLKMPDGTPVADGWRAYEPLTGGGAPGTVAPQNREGGAHG